MTQIKDSIAHGTSLTSPLLLVRDLSIAVLHRAGEDSTGAREGYDLTGHRTVVRNLSFEVRAGETVALVGESGSGKTLSALASIGLLPNSAKVVSGAISFEGQSIIDTGAVSPTASRSSSQHDNDISKRWSTLRGSRIGMVFQEPMSAMNPVLTIGEQVAETVVRHRGMSWRAAYKEAVEMLDRVGIREPGLRARQYLHQLSGGMRQRAMIASAIICRPALLIADEPTTALDVTVQAQILALLKDLQAEMNMGLLLISHDLGVVGSVADRLHVMRGGEIVEEGVTKTVLTSPRHIYTIGLLDALERPLARETNDAAPHALRHASHDATPILRVHGLRKRYAVGARNWRGKRKSIDAVKQVDFRVDSAEIVGLIGESGSGKSTVGRIALGMVKPSGGEVLISGEPWSNALGANARRMRRRVQIVFQDPYASLNPEMSIGESIAEPIRAHKLRMGHAVNDRVVELLEQVGLTAAHAVSRPNAFSGGQRQRIAIARALALEPSLLIADEAVSALDVSVRAQILQLFSNLRAQLGLAILFISHDLGVVRQLCDRVIVMRLGEVVEQGTVEQVLDAPQHSYTQSLLKAVPALPPRIFA